MRRNRFTVTVDPNLHSLALNWYGWQYIDHYIAGTRTDRRPRQLLNPLRVSSPIVTVAELPMATPPHPMALCHSLVGDR